MVIPKSVIAKKSFLVAIFLLPLLFIPGVSRSQDLPFVRGDIDKVDGVNITDAILTFMHIYLGKEVNCVDAVDVNDDSQLDTSDGVHLLAYLFLKSAPPPPPFPECGFDETEDDFSCEVAGPCPAPQGDAYVFIVQRSSSMRNYLQRAKNEIITTLEHMSSQSQIAIVLFDRGLIRWPSNGKIADSTEQNKASAIAFLRSVQTGSGTCELPGFIQALNITKTSTSPRKTIVYYGRGSGTCPGHSAAEYLENTLKEIQTRNTENVQINCIGMGDSINHSFMQRLAQQNGGTFSRIR